MGMIVSKGMLLRFQKELYSKICRTPYEIQLEIVSVVPKKASREFSFEDFVGENPRESKFYTLQALYEKEIPGRVREKYGLPKEVNGIIYLSPLQLTPILGTYKLDWNKSKIHFEGSIQVIDKIVYLEQMYGTCIGVQIFVKDALKGG